jgi:D-alanyl-lipoteichoic acid acyltransferase DltB (MBOAT superfamily)
MLFPTLKFALFFLAAFCIAWGLRRFPRTRLGFLTLASYAFYAAWDWRFCALLFASSTANWWFGDRIFRTVEERRRKMWVAAAVSLNLLALAFFKYFNFFVGSLDGLLESLGAHRELPYLSIVLPVGISFFTFHGISYVVDIYRRKITETATFIEMLLYISFFPQLVAGPIVRASHFLPQLKLPVDPADIRTTRAYLLIIGGLLKKVVIANYLATDLVDDVFFDPTRYGAGDMLLATYGYAVQIYCDFSAYTDIAIGVAALLGYRFPQNFDQPYRAVGLRNFWERWHISLSSWLRDYLYIPLGGNTGDWRRYRNLLLTMLLGGLWHGAAWTFVIWGALHGSMLIAEHFLFGEKNRLRDLSFGLQSIGVLVTFNLVCLTWIFFRSPDLEHVWSCLRAFGHWNVPITTWSPFIGVLLIGSLVAQFLPAGRMAIIERWMSYLPVAAQGALFGAAIVAIDALGPSGVAPFIYFQF